MCIRDRVNQADGVSFAQENVIEALPSVRSCRPAPGGLSIAVDKYQRQFPGPGRYLEVYGGVVGMVALTGFHCVSPAGKTAVVPAAMR